jgi:hypothetical protein
MLADKSEEDGVVVVEVQAGCGPIFRKVLIDYGNFLAGRHVLWRWLPTRRDVWERCGLDAPSSEVLTVLEAFRYMTSISRIRLPHTLFLKSNCALPRPIATCSPVLHAARPRDISSRSPSNCDYSQNRWQTSLLLFRTPDVDIESNPASLRFCSSSSRSKEFTSLSSHPRSIAHSHLHLRFHKRTPRYPSLFAAYKRPPPPRYFDRPYTTHATLNTPSMARKLTDHESDASLSPFANDLSDQAESKVKTKTVTTGRKRKADTAEVQTTKRTRKTVAKTEDDVADIDEPPRTKGRVTKKTKVEEETMEEEVKVDKTSKSAQKVTKKKTTATRTKKQADLSPLAKRTEDTKVRIGAHVSTAGG